MNQFIKNHLNKNDAFLKHTFVIFIGCMIASVLSYLYQLLVIRSLSPFDYGIFSSLFALLYIILIATGVIGIVVTKYTAAYYANREFGKIKSLFTSLSAKILLIGLALYFIFVL